MLDLRFQVSDTCSPQDMKPHMLILSKGDKIFRPVIIFSSIEMMDNHIIWEQASVKLLPDEDMLTNITITIRSCMGRLQYHHIPIRNTPATFPVVVFFARFNVNGSFPSGEQILYMFVRAWAATLSTEHFNTPTAINTYSRFSHSGFCITFGAYFRPTPYQVTTVRAWMPMRFFVSFIQFAMRLIHILIIALFVLYNNGSRCKIVEAADKAGCKVFLKDNLVTLFKCDDFFGYMFPSWARDDYGNLRQELPDQGETDDKYYRL